MCEEREREREREREKEGEPSNDRQFNWKFRKKVLPGNVESRDCDSSEQKVGKVEKGAELIARGSMSGEKGPGVSARKTMALGGTMAGRFR